MVGGFLQFACSRLVGLSKTEPDAMTSPPDDGTEHTDAEVCVRVVARLGSVDAEQSAVCARALKPCLSLAHLAPAATVAAITLAPACGAEGSLDLLKAAAHAAFAGAANLATHRALADGLGSLACALCGCDPPDDDSTVQRKHGTLADGHAELFSQMLTRLMEADFLVVRVAAMRALPSVAEHVSALQLGSGAGRNYKPLLQRCVKLLSSADGDARAPIPEVLAAFVRGRAWPMQCLFGFNESASFRMFFTELWNMLLACAKDDIDTREILIKTIGEMSCALHKDHWFVGAALRVMTNSLAFNHASIQCAASTQICRMAESFGCETLMLIEAHKEKVYEYLGSQLCAIKDVRAVLGDLARLVAKKMPVLIESMLPIIMPLIVKKAMRPELTKLAALLETDEKTLLVQQLPDIMCSVFLCNEKGDEIQKHARERDSVEFLVSMLGSDFLVRSLLARSNLLLQRFVWRLGIHVEDEEAWLKLWKSKFDEVRTRWTGSGEVVCGVETTHHDKMNRERWEGTLGEVLARNFLRLSDYLERSYASDADNRIALRAYGRMLRVMGGHVRGFVRKIVTRLADVEPALQSFAVDAWQTLVDNLESKDESMTDHFSLIVISLSELTTKSMAQPDLVATYQSLLEKLVIDNADNEDMQNSLLSTPPFSGPLTECDALVPVNDVLRTKWLALGLPQQVELLLSSLRHDSVIVQTYSLVAIKQLIRSHRNTTDLDDSGRCKTFMSVGKAATTPSGVPVPK